MFRKLAHVRSPGYGQRTWSGARWVTPGPVQAINLLDQVEITLPSKVTKYTPNGTFTPTPTPVRPALLASFRMTSPLVFQSYFKVHWEDMFGARANLSDGARQLPFRGTRQAAGRAEGQALIDYQPFPAATDLFPSYGAGEKVI